MKDLSVGSLIVKLIRDQGRPMDFSILDINYESELISCLREKMIGTRASEWVNFVNPNWFEEHKDLLSGKKSYWIRSLSRTTNTWFNVLLIPLNLGDHFMAFFQNVTESVVMEEQLKESEEKYRKLFETSYDGFWWLNKEGNLLETNEGLTKMLGYSKEELIGSHWSKFLPDEYLEEGSRAWEEGKTGEIYRYSFMLKRKDKSGIWVDGSIRAIIDSKKEFNGYLVAFKDITKEKNAEQAMIESEKKALRLVKELREKDKNKDEFISLLSHELRNPLASIAAGTKLLEMTTRDDMGHNTIEIIKRQTQQLSKLVDDLLDITRIREKKIEINKKDIVINAILTYSLEGMANKFNDKGIKLIGNIMENPIIVHADPVRILQCLENLLGNALKFTERHGQVIVNLKEEESYALITVEDNGIGISSDVQELIFEPYEQGHQSNQAYNNRGLGLGLALVKDIVKLHDGQVEVYSQGLGYGSIFTIKLPKLQ